MGIESTTGIFYLILNATLVVKIVLGILGAMSIISWTIIFYKAISFYKIKKELKRDIRLLKESHDLASALKTLRTRYNSTIYKISIACLNEIKQIEKSKINDLKKPEIASQSIENTINNLISEKLMEYSSSLSFLATCTNSAPFIGLFGTVWGIMHSFHSIGLQKSAGLATVAPGIAEALIATAIGLAVAIPASIAYNSFISILTGIENLYTTYKNIFINMVKRELTIFSASNSNKNE